VPLAVNIKLADLNTSSVNDDGTVSRVKHDLQFPQEVNIFAAGTLGDRFETVTPADPAMPSVRMGTFNISALVRANVKAMVEYQRDLRVGDNHSLNALLRFAF
jgi:hypothetical protein